MPYSIKALCYATQQVPGPQVYLLDRWYDWYTFNYYVFLIRGEGRTILVDCGMDDVEGFNRLLAAGLGERGLVRPSPREHAVIELLADQGVRPEAVDTIAFTHFHADHASNVRLFPRARFVVSAEGWRRFGVIRRECPRMAPSPLFPAESVAFLEEVRQTRLDLVEDGETPVPGIEIKYVGGHTVDSAAFVIATDAGRVVIPGDTIWTYRNLEQDVPVGSTVDVRQCYDAMAWARGAGDVVVPTHDPLVLDRHPGGLIGRSSEGR
jgi:glyoxylase-like metal-dependent hydrolase (beta-lactamase superfamily II)